MMHAFLYTHPRMAMAALLLMLPFTLIAGRIACLMVPAVLHGVIASVEQSVADR